MAGYGNRSGKSNNKPGGGTVVYQNSLDRFSGTVEVDTGLTGLFDEPVTAELEFQRRNLAEYRPGSNGQFLQVDFRMAGDFDSGGLQGRDAVRAALRIRTEFNNRFSRMPDGTVLRATPYSGDGRSSNRASIYERAGFSSPNSSGHMLAIVRNGRPTPLSAAELRADNT